jgi:hypothetical protein
MDTNSKHQKEAVTTDQKLQDERLRELDKRHLKESEKEEESLIPKQKKETEPSEEN